MFRSLRFRLVIWFVSITTLVFIAFCFLANLMFRYDLTSVLDNELQAVALEVSPAIEIRNARPRLPSWAEGKRKQANSLPATIQLFNANGVLTEQYGPDAPADLFRNQKEIHIGNAINRIWCTQLLQHHKPAGYLQIQLPTRLRDRGLQHFLGVMWKILPVTLIMLGLSGYFFSGLAMRPIEQSFKVLKNFMADAGHELGTPISIIQANAENVQHAMSHDLELNKSLEIIVRSAVRLGNLVRDLTLLAKMENPHMTMSFMPVQLDECVKRVVEECAAPFAVKKVELNGSRLSGATVLGDMDSLTRMVTNLLQNALRYTDSGGYVKVEISIQGRNARLSVSDTGKGVPKESIKHIFDRFYHVDKSRSRSEGGTGLGLAIVKAIAEAHKGRVEVQSIVGAGSTFSVFLPLAH